MKYLLRRCTSFLPILGLLAGGLAQTATTAEIDLLAEPGHVLLLRHANAPGVGDPPGMVLDDCSTQRNLDERGRLQAKKLGERFRAAGISKIQLYSSQWCRCRETARLLAIGSVQDLPALNSLFEQPEKKSAQLKTLRAFLDQLPRESPTVVMVTHQVVVTALTDYFPASGEGIILKLKTGGGFERMAELPASE